MYEALSEHKNSQAFAMSSGVPGRAMGICCAGGATDLWSAALRRLPDDLWHTIDHIFYEDVKASRAWMRCGYFFFCGRRTLRDAGIRSM